MRLFTIITITLLVLQACGKDSGPVPLPPPPPGPPIQPMQRRENYIRWMVLLSLKPIDKVSDTAENELYGVDIFTEQDERFKFVAPGSGTSTISYQLTKPPIDTGKTVLLLEPFSEYVGKVALFGNQVTADSIAFRGTLKPGRDYGWYISSNTGIYGNWKYEPGASYIPGVANWYNRQFQKLSGKGFTVVYN